MKNAAVVALAPVGGKRRCHFTAADVDKWQPTFLRGVLYERYIYVCIVMLIIMMIMMI